MTKRHDKPKRAPRVAEPVQVYLDRTDHSLLESLTRQLGATKSDVVRRSLGALERELTDPAEHPALRVIGIAGGETVPPAAYDVAREHDRYFADLEDARGQGEHAEQAEHADPAEHRAPRRAR
jgi:Arc/MetJ-type ribon-helix-helix transcriptional regulator